MENEVSFLGKVGVQNSTHVIYVPKGSSELVGLRTGEKVKVTITRVD